MEEEEVYEESVEEEEVEPQAPVVSLVPGQGGLGGDMLGRAREVAEGAESARATAEAEREEKRAAAEAEAAAAAEQEYARQIIAADAEERERGRAAAAAAEEARVDGGGRESRASLLTHSRSLSLP